MDRILIILKKENGPRASSAPALGLNTIIFKYVYWYMKQISGERLQDHWSSGFCGAPWEGRSIFQIFYLVYVNDPSHMPKMAAKPMYGKNLQKSS